MIERTGNWQTGTTSRLSRRVQTDENGSEGAQLQRTARFYTHAVQHQLERHAPACAGTQLLAHLLPQRMQHVRGWLEPQRQLARPRSAPVADLDQDREGQGRREPSAVPCTADDARLRIQGQARRKGRAGSEADASAAQRTRIERDGVTRPAIAALDAHDLLVLERGWRARLGKDAEVCGGAFSRDPRHDPDGMVALPFQLASHSPRSRAQREAARQVALG
eukprot:97379-Rhodomonas_salina.3